MSNQRSNLGTDVACSNAVVIPTTHMRLPPFTKTNRGTAPWEQLFLHRQNRATCQDLVSSAVLLLANMQMTTCIVHVYVPCQLTIIVVGLNIFVLMPATSVSRPRSAWISRSCHAYHLGWMLTLWHNGAVKFFLHDDRF